ncbi:unnamed protein product [Rotaria sp. Silwood1]|nr:unnamed protein product [Rotaria sp. Silwood1]
MKFSLDANLDKLKSKKLLVLIKSFLPSPNNPLVTHKQVLKRSGRTSMFTTQYYCNHCSSIVSTLKLGAKICLTSGCVGSQRTLNNNELTEVVTVNIISRLESILARNVDTLTDQTNHLFPPGQYNNKYSMVLYPYKLNNFKTRTHHAFVRIAKHVTKESERTGKQVCIEGIKGYSILLDILNYPCSIIFDYMHLVCIGHVPALI